MFFKFFRFASFLGPFPFDNLFIPFFALLPFFRLRGGANTFLPDRFSTSCKFCTYSWNRTLANLLSNSSISSPSPNTLLLLLLRNVSTRFIAARDITTGIRFLVLLMTVSISQSRFFASTSMWSISMVLALPSLRKLSNFFCFLASCWNAATYFWVSLWRLGKFTWKKEQKKGKLISRVHLDSFSKIDEVKKKLFRRTF